MELVLILVILVICISLIFDFTNGFHDAANAIASCVSTGALKPRAALIMAGVMNLIGAMLGTGVASTIGKGIIDVSGFTESVDENMRIHGLIIILSALIGAISWNIITWWFGLPSSSSHALIGGLAGAGIASSTTVLWFGIVTHVVLPMIISPLVGFFIAFGVMKFVLWLLTSAPYHSTMNRMRFMQRFSAGAMALGHGLQDAQKTMGIIVMALMAAGYHEGANADGDLIIPFWVKVAAALAISLGTYFGGGRIMRTLGTKIIDLTPAHGFIAESVSATVLYLAAYVFKAPISTTQSVSAAIMGVGATRRLSAVRWGVAGNIATAWVLTLPAAGVMAAGAYLLLHLLLPF